jgi:hypothetical protein
LLIQSANNTVRALQIDSFLIGIEVAGAAAANNAVTGCYIGTNGSAAVPNVVGLWLHGAPNNLVGTNVISGNTLDGVEVTDPGAAGNRVAGNFIGTDASGTQRLGNANNGVLVDGGAHDNFVGTNGDGVGDAAEGNVVSANFAGIVLSDAGTTGNVVAGNRVGTDAAGALALGNTDRGVRVTGGARLNRVGTNADGVSDDLERNVISGNGAFGVGLDQAGTTNNTIAGNFIGTDGSGLVALGNDGGLVISVGASNNTVGGTSAASRNVISGSLAGPVFGHGVEISDANTQGNVVLGNFVGTDKNGTRALPNAGDGVFITSSAGGNTVGGTVPGARNVISGNVGDGVGTNTANNRILGNRIGTDVLGLRRLGNGGNGVTLVGPGNVVGGTGAGAANLIAFNGGDGVFVQSGTGNAVRGNALRDNGRLGINLFAVSDSATGVTLNDGADADTGANNLQNFPVLSSATSDGSGTTVQGALLSTRNTTFTLDFYASAAAAPTGFGEGATFLGSRVVTTSLLGFASFTATFASVVPAGQVITATATAPGGNTSEFSEALGVVSGVGISIDDKAVFEGDGARSPPSLP